MFWFLLVTLVVVVAAGTLVVIGGDDGVALSEAQPDRLHDPLPVDRPVERADVEALRLPMTVRGYRMADVDEALDRLGAELAERDVRIAELESALAGAWAAARNGRSLPEERGGHDREAEGGEHGGFGPQGAFGGHGGFGGTGAFGGQGREAEHGDHGGQAESGGFDPRIDFGYQGGFGGQGRDVPRDEPRQDGEGQHR